jgi:4-hydroxythreonine-4-phosphate dehydrogenase
MKLTKIIVTPGDPSGIGAEIVWKALRLRSASWKKNRSILCIGARKPFDRLGARVILADLNNLTPPQVPGPYVWLLDAPSVLPKKNAGTLLEGFQTGWSVEMATKLIREQKADCLVTGPLNKSRLQKGGYLFQGHTDFLAHLTSTKDVTMMLANSQLKVSLVSVHCGLDQVSKRLTTKSIARAIDQTYLALKNNWGIQKPKIAVLALNPHAGEDGIFGQEEIKLISPTISRAKKKWGAGIHISGPHPADTFFAKYVNENPKMRADAVIAMYHDQGLIPVKMLDFANTVNLTLGLPWVRTSVDHGTAFDIVGKNIADPSSLISAIELAERLVRKRSSKNVRK